MSLSDGVDTKPPHPVFDANASPSPTLIIIRHPAYDDKHGRNPGNNVLLALQALDNGGVHYGTALTMCGIVAGNSFNTGSFATTRDGPRMDLQWDSILRGENFYYFADNSKRADQYPIYTCFADWQLPEALPQPWQDFAMPASLEPTTARKSNLEERVRHRDVSCRLSGCDTICQVAHLVPKAGEVWLSRQSLGGIIGGSIDDPMNCIYLRPDIHALMDRKEWAPVLKNGCFVVCTHCKPLLPGPNPLSSFKIEDHNRQLQLLTGICKECLFARLAWATLPRIQYFLRQRSMAEEGTVKIFNGKQEALELTGKRFGTAYNLNARSITPSFTGSPSKRSRENDAEFHEVDATEGLDMLETFYEDVERGRKRSRIDSWASKVILPE